MGSIAALVFIAAAAVAGIYTGTQQTVLSGKATANRMYEAGRAQGIRRVECNDAPVTSSGVTFTCKLWGTDGSTAVFDYTWGRSGPDKSRLVNSTPPTLEAPTRPRSGDD